MSNRLHIARAATRRAFEVRRELGVDQESPLCPIDAADRRGVEVWFSDADSLEGLYVRDRLPKILLPAGRPLGRQVFACAHELGHHELGHGTRLSEYFGPEFCSENVSDEEYSAHVFAGAFLLPRAAVEASFRIRGWSIPAASFEQVYVVACSLGVSFEGLLTHISGVLHLLSRTRAQELGKTSLAKFRQQMTGAKLSQRLVIVDLQWRDIAVDISVGENVLLPLATTFTNDFLKLIRTSDASEWVQAVRPGVSQVSHESGWTAFIRVRRDHFVGLGSVRHLDDPDDQ